MQEDTTELKISELYTYWVEDHNQWIALAALRSQTPEPLANALDNVSIIESKPEVCNDPDAISNLAFYWVDEQDGSTKKVLRGDDSCISAKLSEQERQNYIGYVSEDDYNFIANLLAIEELGEYFFKNAFYAFYYYFPLKGVDVKTFSPLTGNYAKDATQVYYAAWEESVTIMPVDIESFEVLGDGYAKDSTQVFFGKRSVAANVDDFKVLQTYATDGEKVFFQDRELMNADVATFQAMGEFYGKDSSNVWYGEKVLNNADATSFEITDICGSDSSVREAVKTQDQSGSSSNSMQLNLYDIQYTACLAADNTGTYYFGGDILNLDN